MHLPYFQHTKRCMTEPGDWSFLSHPLRASVCSTWRLSRLYVWRYAPRGNTSDISVRCDNIFARIEQKYEIRGLLVISMTFGSYMGQDERFYLKARREQPTSVLHGGELADVSTVKRCTLASHSSPKLLCSRDNFLPFSVSGSIRR